MKSKNLDMQKSILLIVAVLVAGLLIGSAFSTTGEAVRRRPPGGGGPPSGCSDEDNDKFYRTSGCGTLLDCNDNDPYINPNAEEICGNNIDDNCDGSSIICEGNIEIITKKSEYGLGERVILA